MAQLAAESSIISYYENERASSAVERRAVFAVPSTVLAGGVVDAATNAGDLTSAAVAVGTALLVAGGSAASDTFRRKATPGQKVVREAVRRWAAELLSRLAGETDPPQADPTTDGLRTAIMKVLERDSPTDGEPFARVDAATDIDMSLPDRSPAELMSDLSTRLIPNSRAEGDERLTVTLVQLEDRLARWSRSSTDYVGEARRDIYAPLREVIEASDFSG